MKLLFAMALLAATITRAAPVADSPPPASSGRQGFSVIGARALGIGSNILEGGMGWPGVHLTFLHGQSPRLDIGVRSAFNYSQEGAVTGALPGIKVQFVVHYHLLENQQVSLALQLEPGPLFYFRGPTCLGCSTTTQSGFTFPVGLRLGIAASSALNVGLSVEVPLWVAFGLTNVVHVPVVVGGGVEYFLKSNLLVYLILRMGPSIASLPSPQPASFVFEGLVGVGYRF